MGIFQSQEIAWDLGSRDYSHQLADLSMSLSEIRMQESRFKRENRCGGSFNDLGEKFHSGGFSKDSEFRRNLKLCIFNSNNIKICFLKLEDIQRIVYSHKSKHDDIASDISFELYMTKKILNQIFF